MIGRLAISLGALRRNAAALRDLVGAGKAAFVVKSNAYGHGLIETALAIEPFANRICVYAVEEGIALRDGGITARILVLGPFRRRSSPTRSRQNSKSLCGIRRRSHCASPTRHESVTLPHRCISKSTRD